MKLKDIYKASQCTDINDCDIALAQVKEIAHATGWTPALRKRDVSLYKKRELILIKESKNSNLK